MPKNVVFSGVFDGARELGTPAISPSVSRTATRWGRRNDESWLTEGTFQRPGSGLVALACWNFGQLRQLHIQRESGGEKPYRALLTESHFFRRHEQFMLWLTLAC